MFHRRKMLPFHPNGMHFSALNKVEKISLESICCLMGSGLAVNVIEC